jgi:hypothetical protein
MFAKTQNRWILALLLVSVLAFAAPQTAAAAPLQAQVGPAGVSLQDALLGWAAQLWQDLVNTFDATTVEPDPEPQTTSTGEQGGMIDPNG